MSPVAHGAYGPLATCKIAFAAARKAAPRLLEILRPSLGGDDAFASVDRSSAERHVRMAAVTPLLATGVPGAQAASVLGGWYAYAAASDPDHLPYDLSFWRAGASVAA